MNQMDLLTLKAHIFERLRVLDEEPSLSKEEEIKKAVVALNNLTGESVSFLFIQNSWLQDLTSTLLPLEVKVGLYHQLRNRVLLCTQDQVRDILSKNFKLINYPESFSIEKEKLIFEEKTSDIENTTKRILAFIEIQQAIKHTLLKNKRDNHYAMEPDIFYNREFYTQITTKLEGYSTDKLIVAVRKIEIIRNEFQEQLDKLSRFNHSNRNLSEKLFRIIEDIDNIKNLQTIYEKCRDGKGIKSFHLSGPSIVDHDKQHYVDLIRKVCVIKALDLIRDQFVLPKSQLAQSIQELNLSSEAKEAFEGFRVEFKGETLRSLPVAPFYLKTQNDTRYVDLRLFMKSFQNESLRSEDIIDNEEWNGFFWLCLTRSPIECFSYFPISDIQDTTLLDKNSKGTLPLEPGHIQPLSEEELSELEDLIRAKASRNPCCIM